MLKTDVAYCKDIYNLAFFPLTKMNGDHLTTAELLMDFFYYYRYEFNRKTLAIDITNGSGVRDRKAAEIMLKDYASE